MYCWNYCCENVHYAESAMWAITLQVIPTRCFFFYPHFIRDPLCFFHAGHDLNTGLYGIKTWLDVKSSLFQWNCQYWLLYESIFLLAFPETCRICLHFYRIFLCASCNSLSRLHWQECNLHNNTIKHSVTAILSAAAKWPLTVMGTLSPSSVMLRCALCSSHRRANQKQLHNMETQWSSAS